ncbi:PREDICTED: methionine aminopeptidase 1D, mitochondrial [Nicrophorus vespilloides]|uniref:Methionine aminopeptidase n=1 Tax=Nicrophorus vespilloides TaxID=110193 RepID=A0ABM1MRP1_NICVS|nr:PREDICTED: methionine aminopeptidase 1D, mitochondrial [Nicrophorus vespilloides]
MNYAKQLLGCRGLRNFWTQKKLDFGRYALVEPGNVSPFKPVPETIVKPAYYVSGEPTPGPAEPEIKTEKQVSRMRDSCKLAANILKTVGDSIKVGQTTDDIDCLVHKLAIENNAYPSTLNYRNFPKSVCTSVNNVACHGIPDDRPLEDGDIINVDITVLYNGYHGDCSKTYLVGNVDKAGRDLVRASEICLDESIKLCRPGTKFNTLGCFIEQRAYELGFNIVPCFAGHGIGSYFHGPPDIYHFTNDFKGVMLSGMTFTVEPILTQGRREIEIQEDDWTAVTVDNARTAQFEHTILITEDGHEILTLPS